MSYEHSAEKGMVINNVTGYNYAAGKARGILSYFLIRIWRLHSWFEGLWQGYTEITVSLPASGVRKLRSGNMAWKGVRQRLSFIRTGISTICSYDLAESKLVDAAYLLPLLIRKSF
jgi:hypothetical protein